MPRSCTFAVLACLLVQGSVAGQRPLYFMTCANDNGVGAPADRTCFQSGDIYESQIPSPIQTPDDLNVLGVVGFVNHDDADGFSGERTISVRFGGGGFFVRNLEVYNESEVVLDGAVFVPADRVWYPASVHGYIDLFDTSKLTLGWSDVYGRPAELPDLVRRPVTAHDRSTVVVESGEDNKNAAADLRGGLSLNDSSTLMVNPGATLNLGGFQLTASDQSTITAHGVISGDVSMWGSSHAVFSNTVDPQVNGVAGTGGHLHASDSSMVEIGPGGSINDIGVFESSNLVLSGAAGDSVGPFEKAIAGNVSVFDNGSLLAEQNASIASLKSSDNSTVTVSQSLIGDANLQGAIAAFTDSSFGGSIRVGQSATTTIFGGKVGGLIEAFDKSTVTINGGARVDGDVESSGGSISINDASIGGNLTSVGTGRVFLNEGQVHGILTAADASFVQMSGGRVLGDVVAAGQSTIHLLRGEVNGNVSARDDSLIVISGIGIGQLSASDRAEVSASNAASLRVVSSDQSRIHVTGGSVAEGVLAHSYVALDSVVVGEGGVAADSDGVVEVSGGFINSSVASNGDSSITLRSGVTVAEKVILWNRGLINIDGAIINNNVGIPPDVGATGRINVNAGLLRGNVVAGGGEIIINGGVVERGFVTSADATGLMHAGTVLGSAGANGTSVMTLRGGEIRSDNAPPGNAGLAVTAAYNATLNVDGAHIVGGTQTFHQARLNLKSGQLDGDLRALDESLVTISGGVITGEIGLQDETKLFMTGGTVQGIGLFNSSAVDFSSGEAEWLESFHDAEINFYGGSIHGDILAMQGSNITISDHAAVGGVVQAQDNSILTIEGGTIGGDLSLWDQTTLTMSGGHLKGAAELFDHSTLHWTGGSIDGGIHRPSPAALPGNSPATAVAWTPTHPNTILARDGATISIHGTDLVATLVDSNYLFDNGTFSVYTLDGTLADGASVSDTRLYIENDTGASFRLGIVPEPASAALLAGGLLAFSAIIRRRRSGGICLSCLLCAAVTKTVHADPIFYSSPTPVTLNQPQSPSQDNVFLGGTGFDDHGMLLNLTDATVDLTTGAVLNYSVFVYNNSVLNVNGGAVLGTALPAEYRFFVPPGGVPGVNLYDTSALTVSDGSLEQEVAAHQSSRVTIQGGYVSRLSGDDDSTFTISSGFSHGDVSLRDQAQLSMTGGAVHRVFAEQHAAVDVTNANINFLIAGHDQVVITMNGATAGRMDLDGAATASAAACLFQDQIVTADAAEGSFIDSVLFGDILHGSTGSLEIRGGSFQGAVLSTNAGPLTVANGDLPNMFQLSAAGDSRVQITDSFLTFGADEESGAQASGNSELTITGGSLFGRIAVSEQGVARLSQGNLGWLANDGAQSALLSVHNSNVLGVPFEVTGVLTPVLHAAGGLTEVADSLLSGHVVADGDSRSVLQNVSIAGVPLVGGMTPPPALSTASQAVFTMNAGDIGGDVVVMGSSRVELAGVDVAGGVFPKEQGHVTLDHVNVSGPVGASGQSGGAFNAVQVQGSLSLSEQAALVLTDVQVLGSVTSTGGSIEIRGTSEVDGAFTMSGGGEALVRGGRINGLSASDASSFIMSEGEVAGTVEAFDSARVRLAGGTVLGNVETRNTAQVELAGVSLAGDATTMQHGTLTMVSGQIAGKLFAKGQGQIVVAGGIVSEKVEASENASLTVRGGRLVSYLNASDDSHITVTGGVISSFTTAFDNSTIIVGGDAEFKGDLMAFHNSTIILDGGVVDGDVRGLRESTVNMTGGKVGSEVSFRDNSVFNYRGGEIGEASPLSITPHLVAYDNATINIVGSDLSSTLIDSVYQRGVFSVYQLGGLLSSGDSLNDRYLFLENGSSARFNLLAVPETPTVPGDCDGDGLLTIDDANCTADDKLDEFLASLGTLRGDADGDKQVQFPDFVILANNFDKMGTYTQGDFDKDGTVQFADFVLLANNFGKSVAATAAVPEPASGLLAVLAVCGLCHARQRHRRR